VKCFIYRTTRVRIQPGGSAWYSVYTRLKAGNQLIL
jgi:hypothetical protein